MSATRAAAWLAGVWAGLLAALALIAAPSAFAVADPTRLFSTVVLCASLLLAGCESSTMPRTSALQARGFALAAKGGNSDAARYHRGLHA